jgi:hypothetical protein
MIERCVCGKKNLGEKEVEKLSGSQRSMKSDLSAEREFVWIKNVRIHYASSIRTGLRGLIGSCLPFENNGVTALAR